MKKNRLVPLLALACTWTLLQNSAISQQMRPPDMPFPRVGMCSARLGNTLYLIGGASASMQGLHGMQSPRYMRGTKIVQAFDLRSLTWDTTVAPLLTPRVYASAVAVDDSIYVMGGVDNRGNVLNSVEVYDPSSNTWHYTDSMLLAREGAAATAYGDSSILVFGGGGNSSGPYSEVEVYSVRSGTWSKTFPMVLGRVYHKAVRVRNAIYIFGGNYGLQGLLNVIEKYVPGDGTEKISISLRNPRMLFGVAEKGDSVYVISGLGQTDAASTSVELLNLGGEGEEGDSPTTITLDTARVGFVATVADNGQVYLFGGLSPDFRSGVIPLSSVGTISPLTAVRQIPNSLPANFTLSQNYPNPFNPTTTIEFNVPPPGARVSIDIYNMLGEKVRTLVNGYLYGGKHTVSFDGANMASGTYIYRLQTPNGSIYRKMVLIK
ncbi:MAG: T9SS type A sorting domain-containing protein [Bacteroidetes bacterium]|nr:T9SS type A sorting domain-containing protein [Bacteroidota bacterium]